MENERHDKENPQELNDRQKEAVDTVDGALLIIAGPGTGKTKTLIARAVHMIVDLGKEPGSILMATFTEKAANELKTKLTEELAKKNIYVNINEMYIGTFHSICRRILTDNPEYTRLKHEYTQLDEFDQQYLIYKHWSEFINDTEPLISPEEEDERLRILRKWQDAASLREKFDRLTEEQCNIESMKKDQDQKISNLANNLETYKNILADENKIDFANLQTECLALLNDVSHPEVLKELQDKIQYLMIDEYQDTNYIQEQLILKLGTVYDDDRRIVRQNICVVGDDDQSLYRFRGATIENILSFENTIHDMGNECKVITLNTNYRSNCDIVDFCGKWINSPVNFEWEEGSADGSENKKYRLEKTIQSSEKSRLNNKAVVKLSAKNNVDALNESILAFINKLKDRIDDYNQIAFIFSAFKGKRSAKIRALAKLLEDNDIPVYSPRSYKFFERKEIKYALGALMNMFPEYDNGAHSGVNPPKEFKTSEGMNYDEYCQSCREMAADLVKKQENHDLSCFIEDCFNTHKNLTGETNYNFSGLLYRLFAFSPFKEWLDKEINSSAVELRPARNLAILSGLIEKYEHLENLQSFSGAKTDGETRKVDHNVKEFFNEFMRIQFENGINEYEDDSEYAPRGCVSFMTMYQAKGLEFPIVFVGSLDESAWEREKDPVMKKIEDKYSIRRPFEPPERVKYFDFWRKYYTAFSRAQDLLVLISDVWQGSYASSPSEEFRKIFEETPDAGTMNPDEFTFHEVRPVKLMKALSFTSHTAVYASCPLRYKFDKELHFTTSTRNDAEVFGSLVHETIEDINKMAIRGRKDEITANNVKKWFDDNYKRILTEDQGISNINQTKLDAALDQVQRYATDNADRWDDILEAEAVLDRVSKAGDENFIMEGRADLIRRVDDKTIEIIDFKTEHKKEILENPYRYDRYRNQLQLYAYLIKRRDPDNKYKYQIHLYCTKDPDDPIIDFTTEKLEDDINKTVDNFKATAQKIIKKEYESRPGDPGIEKSEWGCRECNFRFYCKKTPYALAKDEN